ncbi:MAG: hypothetical protein VB858_07475, partial [Planctomycetaceae bacterium]
PGESQPGQSQPGESQPGQSQPQTAELGTGFVPKSPETTAQLMAGSQLLEQLGELIQPSALSEALAAQAGQSQPGQPQASAQTQAQADAQSQSQSNVQSQSESQTQTPQSGKASAQSSQAAREGQFSENEPTREEALSLKDTSGPSGNSQTASKKGDRDIQARKLEQQPWFARLPKELRAAIRAGSQRRAPRAYEERLRRYFQSVD